MIDIKPQRNTRSRSSDKRATVTAAVPLSIAVLLDDAADRLQTNRNRLIAAALEVGVPLVEAQVRAASAGQKR